MTSVVIPSHWSHVIQTWFFLRKHIKKKLPFSVRSLQAVTDSKTDFQLELSFVQPRLTILAGISPLSPAPSPNNGAYNNQWRLFTFPTPAISCHWESRDSCSCGCPSSAVETHSWESCDWLASPQQSPMCPSHRSTSLWCHGIYTQITSF